MATTFPATRAAAKPTWPITKIALAVDATPESHRATELARDMAANIGAEVIVLHFRESSLARYGGPEPAETSDQTRGIIGEVVGELTSAGIAVVAAVEDLEPVATAAPIAREAERFGAGLIIVGSRGLSTGRAALSGSVSHDLIHASRLPVLIVH